MKSAMVRRISAPVQCRRTQRCIVVYQARIQPGVSDTTACRIAIRNSAPHKRTAICRASTGCATGSYVAIEKINAGIFLVARNIGRKCAAAGIASRRILGTLGITAESIPEREPLHSRSRPINANATACVWSTPIASRPCHIGSSLYYGLAAACSYKSQITFGDITYIHTV